MKRQMQKVMILIDRRFKTKSNFNEIAKPDFSINPLLLRHKDLLKKYANEVDVDHIISGCETELVEACSVNNGQVMKSEVKFSQVMIDPLSGRGVLNADAKILSRFTLLNGQ